MTPFIQPCDFSLIHPSRFLFVCDTLTHRSLSSGAVYIDTERKFSAARLAEMVTVHTAAAEAAVHHAAGGGGPHVGGAVVSDVLQRVLVMTPRSTGELVGAIEVCAGWVGGGKQVVDDVLGPEGG